MVSGYYYLPMDAFTIMRLGDHNCGCNAWRLVTAVLAIMAIPLFAASGDCTTLTLVICGILKLSHVSVTIVTSILASLIRFRSNLSFWWLAIERAFRVAILNLAALF